MDYHRIQEVWFNAQRAELDFCWLAATAAARASSLRRFWSATLCSQRPMSASVLTYTGGIPFGKNFFTSNSHSPREAFVPADGFGVPAALAGSRLFSVLPDWRCVELVSRVRTYESRWQSLLRRRTLGWHCGRLNNEVFRLEWFEESKERSSNNIIETGRAGEMWFSGQCSHGYVERKTDQAASMARGMDPNIEVRWEMEELFLHIYSRRRWTVLQ